MVPGPLYVCRFTMPTRSSEIIKMGYSKLHIVYNYYSN